MKKLIIVLTLILLALLFTVSKKDIVAFNTEAQDDYTLIASIPEKNTYLYALPQKGKWYQGMILSINGEKKFFDWGSTGFLSFLPNLTFLDLNNDGKEELVVLLIQNHGTGIIVNEVHIINPEDLSEYPVQNALDIIEENVESNILSEKEVDIKINNTIYNVKIGDNTEGYTGAIPSEIPKVYYEDHVRYYLIDFKTLIMDNILRAKVGVETQPLRYLGWIIIEYSFKDGEFKANEIIFEGEPTIIVNTHKSDKIK